MEAGSVKILFGRRLWILLCILSLALATGYGFWEYQRNPSRGLPYHDSFAGGKAEEWKAFGGTWELMNGSMRNDSDERGAKLLTGSQQWLNYSIEADVMLLGEGGNAGLIVRSSDEEEGVDAYTGYYAGLRNLDHSLVLGRAGHGWMEVARPVSFPGNKVLPGRWYHLKLLAYGCQLIAAADQPSQPTITTLSVKDVDCVVSGRAGLRSYASGGVWRNVVVRPASQQDAAVMLAMVQPQDALNSEPQIADSVSLSGFHAPQAGIRTQALPSSPNTQPISKLRLFPFARQERATVRGVVILASPELFVQDSTGGVLVKPATSETVRVGDEVEATGLVRPGDSNATLDDATVRVLWAGTPMPALSVTASQAATGAFDAEFIEVEGRLRHKEYGADDTLVFDLDSGPQSFRAVMKRGRGDSLYNRLREGSLLRIRGVSVVDSSSAADIAPFTLLVRSTDDFVELAGPPWWSARHLVAMAIGFLLLALLANFVYHRVDNWRLRAIVEEREHLAFEMHDTLAQGFAGIGFQLEAIRTGVPEEFSRMRQQIDLASDLVRHSHAEARRTVEMLRPQQLESEGLLSALAFCARRLVTGGSVAVTARSVGDVQPIPLRLSDNLYRIGQEALANAVRHAHAANLGIILEYKKTSVRLLVSDDGRGFTNGDEQTGFGVLGMRKRAASIGASLDISSDPAEGTRVAVIAPLPPRLTFHSWPQLLLKFLRERINHATTPDPAHPHPYRG
jgi:signal transduction histidine kinase